MSKLGFHVATAKRNGAGNLLTAGAPLVVMVDQNMIDEAHQAGAIAAFRTQVLDDNPANFMAQPLSAMPSIAEQWMNGLKPKWDLNPGADYYIINNEQDIGQLADAEKLNAFFLTCMQIANSWNLKVGICSFSTGCPSDSVGLTLEQRWAPMLPAVKYCVEHQHVVVLHAHCMTTGSMMTSGEWESLRHQRTLRYFASQNLRPKVIIGELSNGVGGIEPDLAGYLQNVTWWDQQVMASEWRDQVIGGALYGFNAAEHIDAAVPSLVNWIANHPTPVTPPPSTKRLGDAREPYARVYYRVNQHATKAQWLAACDLAYQSHSTVGMSNDDAGIGVDLKSKKIIEVGGEFTPAVIDPWYLTEYGVTDVQHIPYIGEIPALPVPWLSQLGLNATFAPGDCGTADVAMILNYRGKVVTVDQVSKATGYPSGFTSLSAVDLQNVAATFGLPLLHGMNQVPAILMSEIAAKRPVMALVNYAVLPAALKFDMTYTRGHWILIVGFDGATVIWHDPYEVDAAHGAFKQMTWAEFDLAWSTTNADFSFPRQILRIGQIVPPATPVLRGLQMRADGGSTTADYQALTVAKLDSAKVMTNTSCESSDGSDELAMLCRLVGGSRIVLRLFAAGDNPSLNSPAQFFDQARIWLNKFAAKGGLYVEVHNEPNLPQEGLGRFWMTGPGFGAFYAGVADLIHQNYPTLKVGYPGLSPNTPNESEFIANLKLLIAQGKVDWIGAHSYWINAADMNVEDNGRHYRRFLSLGKVIITEFANVGTTDSDLTKGQQYKAFFASLESGIIGAYCFVSSASDPFFNTNRMTWVSNGVLSDIPTGVGT